MTVAELQARISSAEFSEWIEFYKLEPFGSDADFEGHAMVATMVHNRTIQDPKKEKPLKVSDLMRKDPDPPQSASQMLQMARMLTIAHGGEVNK
jgi:hypothetical protein